MADNTTLNSGTGGDTLRTEDVGGGVKVPVSKIHTGAAGVDGGPVTTSNPFPTQVQSGSLVSLLLGGNATPVSLSNPVPVSGAMGVLVAGSPASAANPLPAQTQSGSLVALLLGGSSTPVSLSNPLPTSGSTGILIGGVQAAPTNPVPVSGALGVLVAGSQASAANPLPVQSQSGSLTAVLLGGSATPVSFSNPFPISGSVGVLAGGVNISRTNPLSVEQASEGSGQILSGSTVRTVNYGSTDVSASGSTQLVAPQGAGNKVRVLSFFAMSNGTVIGKFQSTGSAGTITTLSGYIPMGGSGGFVLPHNPHGWFQTLANEGLNLSLTAATNVGVVFTWMLA